jgi:AraC family transcriptional regulator
MNIVTTENKSGLPEWVGKIKSIVKNQYTQNITIEMLSKEAGIDPKDLSKQFYKYCKGSLYHYIVQVKIEKSIPLINENKYTISEIAEKFGFKDPSHFSRCFLRIYGVTPSRYRRLIESRKMYDYT